MKCAIIQPCYIPWRGYFDIIHNVDVFVFHDDIQYTKQDWRNRNRIKTPNGPKWLTVPVGNVPTNTNINQVRILAGPWGKEHLRILQGNYHLAPHFSDYRMILEDLLTFPWKLLSELDIRLTIEIARLLGIKADFVKSSDLMVAGHKTERVLAICKRINATHYLSGPAAADYLEEIRFADEGIKLSYQKYDYPPHPQMHGAFEPNLSIIDLLFNCGPFSPNYIWNRQPTPLIQ